MSLRNEMVHIDADLSHGATVKVTFVETVPLAVDQLWSAFEDYLALQRSLAMHEDTELEPGPNNGVGATIRFSFRGGITRETLVVKDDVRHIWKIELPEPNVLFSSYALTVSADKIGDNAAVTLTIEAVMSSRELEERKATLRALEQAGTRIGQLTDFVLRRDGLRGSFDITVRYPLQRFWAVVSNWGDVSWVQGATGVQVIVDGVRLINFGSSVLKESLVASAEQTHTLTYQVVDGELMPVRIYQGTVHLEAVDDETTRVTYSYVFLPRAGIAPEVAKAQLDQSLEKRLTWVQATFDVDSKDRRPSVCVAETVRAPIDQVWALFRPFGPEIMTWWPIYEWVELEPPGRDEIGSVRSFAVRGGRTYKERLAARDDARYLEQYELVDASPPLPVKGILTTVEMIPKGPQQTLVRWSARIDAEPGVVAEIEAAQAQAYRGAIEFLDRHFQGGDLLLASFPGVARRLAEEGMALWQQLSGPEEQVYRYDRYPRLPQLPDVPLEQLPRMTVGLPPNEAFSPGKLASMLQRIIEYAYSQTHYAARTAEAEANGTDPFEAYFGGYIERPDYILARWRDDAEFCRQLIQGLNPMVIRVCRSTGEVPPSLAHLTAQGLSVKELIDERRLFILDYVHLAGLERYRDMIFYAPLVLVYREILEGGGSRLNLLGIQLTRHEGKNEIYTPDSSTPNKYLFAKLQVECADNQYHQFIYHLGFAHLAMEPLAIASHNAFYGAQASAGVEHPIGKMLAPHFHDTIAINFAARQTLVRSDPQSAFTDRTFAPGTAQGMQMVWSAWRQFDFFGDSFPEDLAARGFDESGSDGVEDFFYRDDGFRIWRAIEAYAGDVVTAVYADDAAVVADPALQAWAYECSAQDRGAMPGFPKALDSRALLVKTLTAVIFRASAYHAAINCPQLDYLSYVPNRAPALFLPMPEDGGDITPEYILRAMPGKRLSHFKILFAYLLVTPPEHTLTNMIGLAEEYPEIHARFKASLDAISKTIRTRNEALVLAGKAPYPYLQPERIPTSVAV